MKASNNDKRLILLGISALALTVLTVLYIIFELFLFNAIIHVTIRLLVILAVAPMLQKYFKSPLAHSERVALALCGAVTVIDLVIVDTVRFILSGGTYTVLFLPACIPICFMIITLQPTNEPKHKTRNTLLALLIGIPLSLLAIYLEVYSFIHM